jgi:hypothetical protein
MANISNVVSIFPERHLAIRLETDEEIFVTIASINVFGERKVSERRLWELEPDYVIACLQAGLTSELFSNRARVICKQIVDKYQEQS